MSLFTGSTSSAQNKYDLIFDDGKNNSQVVIGDPTFLDLNPSDNFRFVTDSGEVGILSKAKVGYKFINGKSITIDADPGINDTAFSIHGNLKEIYARHIIWSYSDIECSDCSFYLEDIKGSTLTLSYLDLKTKSMRVARSYVYNSQFSTLEIGRSSLDGVVACDSSKIDSINFNSDSIKHSFSLLKAKMPRVIALSDLFFDNEGTLDLTNFYLSNSRPCKLIFSAVDISKIKFNYSLFDVEFEDEKNIPQKELIYKQILDNQQLAGYKDGYEKADIEFQKIENSKKRFYGNFLNFVETNWNNFGYNKEYIFRNSIIIFLIIYILNLFCYTAMVDKAYTLREFKEVNSKIADLGKSKALLHKAFYCFLYTGIIFWGLKISIENIQISKSRLGVWVICQYIIGLVILAFIANVVIGK
jgi:hypothetical protein